MDNVNNTHENIVEVSHLVKKFKDFTAVDDITFNVQKGKYFRLFRPQRGG